MWKCPVCNQKNIEERICPSCGFDDTKNYIRYRLLCKLNPAACREYRNTFIMDEGTLEKEIESFKKQDYTDARYLFSRAVQKGDALSQYWLGCSLLESGEEAEQAAGLKWLEKSAFQGFSPAQINLGYYYYKRVPEAQAAGQASDWFWKAANQGDGVGALWLGICYYLGRGCKQNYATAFRWFQKAEEMWKDTDEWAVYFWLGICCYYGHGTDKNVGLALEYLTKSWVYPEYLEEYMYKNGEVAFFNLVAYYLGRCFYEGTGVTQNVCKAFLHFRKAADDFKIPDAWYWLGLCYLNGTGTVKNISKAETCFKIAAEGESEYNTVRYAKRWRKESYFYIEEKLPREYRHEAECSLADCFWQRGRKEEAERLYRKAALGGCREAQNRLDVFFDKAGDANAQYSLGCRYYNGTGVAQNYGEAVKCFEKAAVQDHPKAQYILGVCYYYGRGVEQDYRKAVSWYEKAADQENDDAQNNLGVCYDNGHGVPLNKEKAVVLFGKAAVRGHKLAQYNLGLHYARGEGVPQDYVKAAEWYEKAAMQGDADAQYRLGNLYYYARGLSQDYKKAVSWYEKAADQDHADAQNNLGVCYDSGQGVSLNKEKAAALYEKAALQGHKLAQYNLGYCYATGKGVPQDYDRAAKWYEQAANQGDADAQKALKEIRQKKFL